MGSGYSKWVERGKLAPETGGTEVETTATHPSSGVADSFLNA